MKTFQIFFKAALFPIISLFVNTFALAQVNNELSKETNFAYQVICSDSSSYNLMAESRNNLERNEMIGQRQSFKSIIESAAESISSNLKNQNYESAAYTCAIIDELTMRFTLDCFDLSDQKIDLEMINQACESLLNTYN